MRIYWLDPYFPRNAFKYDSDIGTAKSSFTQYHTWRYGSCEVTLSITRKQKQWHADIKENKQTME